MTRFSAPACSDLSQYIGIPYREPNSAPGSGLTCWELCEKIMIEVFGTVPPKYSYSIQAKAEFIQPVFINELAKWKPVASEERSAGDLVLLNMAGYPIHLGILIDKKRMIHTLRGIGSMCEFVDSSKWRRRVSGFFRWGPTE